MKQQFRSIAAIAVVIFIIATMVACGPKDPGSDDSIGNQTTPAPDCRWGDFYPDADEDGLPDSFESERICLVKGEDYPSGMILTWQAGDTLDPCLDDHINQKDNYGICLSHSSELYSIPEYDGTFSYLHSSMSLNWSERWASIVSSQFGIHVGLDVKDLFEHHAGFVTFDISEVEIDNIERAVFQIFKVSDWPKQICPNETQEVIRISRLLLSSRPSEPRIVGRPISIYDLMDCHLSWKSENGYSYNPPDCSLIFPLRGKDFWIRTYDYFELSKDEEGKKGWYYVDTEEFAEYLRSDIDNDTEYLTFIIEQSCNYDNGDAVEYPNHHSWFEDSDNSNHTGKLPTLIVEYKQ